MKDVYLIFKNELGNHGFKTQGGRSWKIINDLIVVVQVVRSQWLDAYYINIGILPVTFMVKNYPPSIEFCEETCRATDIKISPFYYTYYNFEKDGTYNEADLNKSISWLVKWTNLHYEDTELVRKRYMSIPIDEIYPGKNIMYDWAYKKLQLPSYYLSGPTKYFG